MLINFLLSFENRIMLSLFMRKKWEIVKGLSKLHSGLRFEPEVLYCKMGRIMYQSLKFY